MSSKNPIHKVVDFRIVSRPVKIAFTCPFCEEETEIPFGAVDAPSCWSDKWPEVKCPECEQTVSLGDWQYD